jgi:hypothetical protein
VSDCLSCGRSRLVGRGPPAASCTAGQRSRGRAHRSSRNAPVLELRSGARARAGAGGRAGLSCGRAPRGRGGGCDQRRATRPWRGSASAVATGQVPPTSCPPRMRSTADRCRPVAIGPVRGWRAGSARSVGMAVGWRRGPSRTHATEPRKRGASARETWPAVRTASPALERETPAAPRLGDATY